MKAKINQYGHRIGSKAAFLDQKIKRGTSQDAIVLASAKQFEKPITVARIKSHVRHLLNEKHLNITSNKNANGNVAFKINQ